MNLKFYTWACLLIGLLPLAFHIFESGQFTEAASLFTTAMLSMVVGFELVRKKLEELRPEAWNQPPSPRM